MAPAPELTDSEFVEAVRLHWAPVLRVVGLPQIAAEAPTESVMMAVQSLAQEPLCLERGELLTTIERLGTQWTNVLLQYVCQVKPYNLRETAFDCYATLLNVGERPVNVIKRVRIRNVATLTGNIMSDGWSEVANVHKHDAETTVVDPGKTVELIAERAIPMLRRYSWEARTAAEQSTTSRLRSEFPLREVAYRAEWVDFETGERHSVDSSKRADVATEGRRRSSAT